MENKLYKDTLLTEKGYEAANLAANGQGSFTITRVVASENAYKGKNENELRQLLSLDNEIPGAILEENTVNTKMAAIKTGLSNELNTNGYVANTIGLYAKLNGGDEFLYSVTPSENGQIVPRQDNNVFSGFKLTIYVLVGNSQKLEVNLSPGGDATIDYVNKAVSKCKDEILAMIDNARFNKGNIDNKTDLNKVIDPGTYWCNFMVPINSPKQFISGMYPRFKLIVSSPVSGIVHQIILLLDGAGAKDMPSVYARSTYSGSQWNEWQAMASDSDLKSLSSSFYSKIDLKENASDHKRDIDNLRTTINDDIQPKLDKKENASDHVNDMNGLRSYIKAVEDDKNKKENASDHASDMNNTVKDNHDGTISYNGNNYAINKTINSSTDYNNITTPGTYLCILSSKWPNTPLAGTGVSATVILKVENDNAGDIFQTAYAPAIYKPLTRQYSFGKWSAWKQLALQSDVDGLNSYIAAVESDKNKKEYASDHVNDMNGLRSATMIVRDSNYSDSWSGLLDGGHLPGWYYGGPNSKDAPEGWSGYGSGLVWGAVDIFALLIDNSGKTWSGHRAGWGFTGWKRLDNQEDLINLQNQVNGVLARQHDIMVNLANVYAGGNLDLLQTIAFTNGKMTLMVYSSLSGSAMGRGEYDFKTKILTLNFGYIINNASWDYGKGEYMYIDISPLYKYFSGWSMGATNMNLRNNTSDSINVSFGNQRIFLEPGRTQYGGGFQNNAFDNATIVLNHN